jgi:hypothetical protein
VNKKTVLELSNYTHNKIIEFGKYYKKENFLETSFSDWNVSVV